MIKRFLMVPILLGSLAVFAHEYRNLHENDLRMTYSFSMVKKLNDRAGIFNPAYSRIDYVDQAYGNALTARGGGRAVVRKTPVRREGKEKRNVVIVGYDLTNMSDGEIIALKDGQVLWQIGTYAAPRGKTFAVYSLLRNDKVDRYLQPAPPASTICCPHCGKDIQLIPVAR